MVIEIAKLTAKPGTEEQFRTAVVEGLKVIRAQPQHIKSWIAQGVETPNVFTLVVYWESIERKMEFRNGPEFPNWRKHITDLLDGTPEAAHWDLFSES